MKPKNVIYDTLEGIFYAGVLVVFLFTAFLIIIISFVWELGASAVQKAPEVLANLTRPSP